jgi:hypothetical protein
MRVSIRKIIFGLVLASLSACTAQAQNTPDKPNIAEAQNAPAKPNIASILPPILVFGSLDKTGSAPSSKIPNAASKDFQPIVEKIKQQGGEIRVGIICDDSDKPLASFYLAEPPTIPTAPDPLPKAGKVNPLELPKLRKEHSAKVAEYDKQMASYKTLVAERNKEADRRSQDFITQLDALTSKPSSCQSTDIVGMVKRGDLFLSETNRWQQTPKKFALLITDGVETRQAPPKSLRFTSEPKVVLVSSGGQTGILQPLLGDNNQPYESIASAVRFITE